MALPPFLQVRGDAVLLSVKATPRASRNEIVGTLGAQLKIKIAAPPVDSAANDELVRFLAEILECPRSTVTLARGASSRSKVVQITGKSADAIAACLASGKE